MMEWRRHAEGEWPSVDWGNVTDRITKLEERIEITASELCRRLGARS